MSKITMRVPTRQYAYIEVVEDIDPVDPQKVVERYFELEDEYRKQANEMNNKGKSKEDIFDEGLDKLK